MKLPKVARRVLLVPKSHSFLNHNANRASLTASHRSLQANCLFPLHSRHISPRQSTSSPFARHSSSGPNSLKRTPYYDLHEANGATLVPFAGYSMPVSYNNQSHIESHNFTRTHASLFDVSHMVQSYFTGPGAGAFLERVSPAALQALKPHTSTLATLLWPDTGGIVDDTVITKLDEEKYYIVTNAACREKDNTYFAVELEKWKSEKQPPVERQLLENWGLLALQGPLAAEVLTGVLSNPMSIPSLASLFFGASRLLQFVDSSANTSTPILVTRTGYTGEDGFEISIPPEYAVSVAEALLRTATSEKLRLAGLGARDSLRLEAGMCLYGHDLDDVTTPVEASLGWTIAKSRRETGGFNGADIVLRQLKPRAEGGGTEKKRVGFLVQDAPAREGAVIMDEEGKETIGKVTSGAPSPSLGKGKNIAMGYVKTGSHKIGTELSIMVRGKSRPAIVTKMPFIPTQYWRGTT
ncbi:MAG: Aminomethyltransferase, mitochondrial [Vezdaea aestivalis]|nr:MAG: Aminomethyltransferase, mitochondrial [Vezdaea aestivalis]